jgi:hypothetical protein
MIAPIRIVMRGVRAVVRRGVSVLAILGLFVVAAPIAGAPGVAGDDWLAYVNSVRALANLPPVTENPAWSAGAVKHNQYMIANGLTHGEDASLPGYTAEGNDAGNNGNVFGGTGNYTFRDAIDSWMTGPFHGAGIIDPALSQVGFAITASTPPGSTYATLDVLRGRAAAPSYPVFFPGNGKTIPYRTYDGTESPDPLSGCAGYSASADAPSGAPIYLLLANTPAVTAFSLAKDGAGNVAVCEFDETNYANPDQQDLGRGVLAMRHAVVLMPQAPLTAGVYRVSITNGGTPVAWSFTVAG